MPNFDDSHPIDDWLILIPILLFKNLVLRGQCIPSQISKLNFQPLYPAHASITAQSLGHIYCQISELHPASKP